MPRVLRLLLVLFLAAAIVPAMPMLAHAGGKGGAGKGEGGGGRGEGGGGKGEGGGGKGEGGGGKGEGGGGKGEGGGGKGDDKGGGKGDDKGGDKGKEKGEDKGNSASRVTPPGVVQSILTATGIVPRDAELARLAVARGEIKPLGEILGVVGESVAGRVLDVELDRRWFDGWVYRVTVLGVDGRYNDVDVDAGGGKILDVRKR